MTVGSGATSFTVLTNEKAGMQIRACSRKSNRWSVGVVAFSFANERVPYTSDALEIHKTNKQTKCQDYK